MSLKHNQNRWSAALGRKLQLQTFFVGTLIGLGCIALLIRQVDLKQSWNTLGRLNGPFLIVPFGVFFANLPLRAWRWQLIFPPTTRPRFLDCLIVLGIGNMANFLLPGRAGDVTRCVLLGDGTSLAGSTRALATLALEKILDGFALIGMVLFAAWSLHPPHWVVQMLTVGIIIFGTAISAAVLLRLKVKPVAEYLKRIFQYFRIPFLAERIAMLLTSFAEGLSASQSAPRMLVLFFLTAAIWTTEALLVWGLGNALGLMLSVKSAVVASAVLGLGLMIPAAPGGVGTYELFGTEAFRLTGMAASGALALTVVIHAWVYVVNIVAGMCLLTMKGMSMAQLRGKVAGGGTPSTVRQSG